MADDERVKWDKRYAEPGYRMGDGPKRFLVELQGLLPRRGVAVKSSCALPPLRKRNFSLVSSSDSNSSAGATLLAALVTVAVNATVVNELSLSAQFSNVKFEISRVFGPSQSVTVFPTDAIFLKVA